MTTSPLFRRSSPKVVRSCTMGVRISGFVDASKLERAAQLLAFDGAGSELRRVAVHTPFEVFRLVELHHYAEQRESALLDLIGADARQALDLERTPGWRCTLYRLDDQLNHLQINTDASVVDLQDSGALLRRLSEIYTALLRHEPPASSTRYAKNTCFSERTSTHRSDAASHWDKTLRHPLPILQLPLDHPRSAQHSGSAAVLQSCVPADLATELRDLVAHASVSLESLVLAAYAVFLQEITQQNDFLLGVANSSQDRVPGNLLAMRVQVDKHNSYEHLARCICTQLSDATTFRNDLAAALLKSRKEDPSSDPLSLISTCCAFHDTADLTRLFPDLKTEVHFWEEYATTADFDLSLWSREWQGQLQVNFAYRSDVLEQETVSRFSHLYLRILRLAVSHFSAPIGAHEALPEMHRRMILESWNDTQVDYDLDRTFVERFESQVTSQPAAIALIARDEQLSYRALHDRANAIADRIGAAGSGLGAVVGIFHERNASLIAGLLGVFKAGCAYLPLDPNYPVERIALMLRESGVRLVISTSKLRGRLLSLGEPVSILCTDEVPSELSTGRHEELASARTNKDALAYIIFTSGSTGRPKGAAIGQRGLTNLLCWCADLLTPARLQAVMATSSICFDSSVFEIFAPLAAGGRIILLESAVHVGTASIVAPGRLLSCAPSVAQELLRAGWIPPDVATIVLAGEKVPGSLVTQLHALPQKPAVYNFYGLTEATVYSTYANLVPGTDDIAPIGKPISNTQMYVLDGDLRPVAVGVTGEIFIGGIGVSRGYINRPDLNTERFPQNPFRSGERLCRTGDTGYFRADGMLVCTGRIDDQIKIRGFRIEPGEIEACLSRHPAVSRCTVLARLVPNTGLSLVAYYVPAVAQCDAEELRAWLRDRLPRQMIPAYFLALSAMPLNHSGKVDRVALPVP
jgi:amino acid adenylation domain-containing protein